MTGLHCCFAAVLCAWEQQAAGTLTPSWHKSIHTLWGINKAALRYISVFLVWGVPAELCSLYCASSLSLCFKSLWVHYDRSIIIRGWTRGSLQTSSLPSEVRADTTLQCTNYALVLQVDLEGKEKKNKYNKNSYSPLMSAAVYMCVSRRVKIPASVSLLPTERLNSVKEKDASTNVYVRSNWLAKHGNRHICEHHRPAVFKISYLEPIIHQKIQLLCTDAVTLKDKPTLNAVSSFLADGSLNKSNPLSLSLCVCPLLATGFHRDVHTVVLSMLPLSLLWCM